VTGVPTALSGDRLETPDLLAIAGRFLGSNIIFNVFNTRLVETNWVHFCSGVVWSPQLLLAVVDESSQSCRETVVFTMSSQTIADERRFPVL
jgi:hypothetical protein